MAEMTIPSAPEGSRDAGRRLWRSVLEEFDLEEHELALLREATRTVDLLDVLDAAVRRDGAVIVTAEGHPRAHKGVGRVADAQWGRGGEPTAAPRRGPRHLRHGWRRCAHSEGPVRRRERATGELVPPDRLVRFELADWPNPGPPPPWWDAGGYPWHLFEARLRWVRARRRWKAEHGYAPEAVSAMRCGR